MNAKWITNGTPAPFYTRKSISLEKKPVRAEAKVCGLGQFNFYINGEKVSDHILDPGWTDYDKLVQYVTFDVTETLQEGKNVLAAEVGNGWYHKMDEGYTFHFPGFMPPNPNPYHPFGPCLVLAVELTLTYEDGSGETIQTGTDWKTAAHPVVMSNVYGSERIDHRLEQKDWNTVDFDDSSWKNASLVPEKDQPGGKLIPQTQPAVKGIKTYHGKYLSTVNGRKIYDLGQNLSGMLHITLKGKRGAEVRIYPAEKLKSDGDVDQMAKGWVLIDTVVTCIPGKDDVYESFDSTFTYIAGRYLAVEGEAEIGEVSALAITSAWKEAGEFSCDDERYDQVYRMVERAVEANLLSVHTDCPTIERFAWQEPNHLMAPSIFYMKDGKKLWEKFLLDLRTAQHTGKEIFYDNDGKPFHTAAGLVPSQAPCYVPNVLPVPGMGSFYDIIPWGSTCILGTWWHYWFYGDESVLRDNYETGLRYLAHLKTKVNEEGFLNHGLGDWGHPKQQYARENVETAFLYADTITLAKMAAVLKKEEDEAQLKVYAEQVKENYNQKLLRKHPETGRWCYSLWSAGEDFSITQACEALPLYWRMVPEEKEVDVAAAFELVLREQGAFISGEVGLPYIIQTARKYGLNDLIAEFVVKKDHPSYYAFVLDGETTLGEYWEQNPRSHCHDMMGHIVEWYYNGMLGILPEAPGFSKVLIQPFLPKSMHRLEGSYMTPAGKIEVHIQETEKEIRVNVIAPLEIAVRVDLKNLEGRGKKVVEV